MTPGYNSQEVDSYFASQSWQNWLDNPLNLPYLVLVKVLSLLHPHSFLVVRIASVMFALAGLMIFAKLLHSWQDMRTSIIGTLLVGTSAWFLHVARFGTPEVLSFGVFALVACAFWAKQSNNWLPLLLCLIGFAGYMYVPGMVWFLIFGAVWQWKVILRLVKDHVWVVAVALLALAIIIAPIIWSLYKTPSLILPYLGLPQQMPHVFEILKNVIRFPYNVLVHAPDNPALWLGRAPLLDAFSTAMFALGGYLYLRQYKLGRTPVFLSVILLTLVLSSFGGYVTFSVVIPFIYVLIAVGTSYLFDTWLMTFPRNPIARTTGWVLMTALLAVVVSYHLNHYFIGWPSADATAEVFKSIRP